MLPQLTGVPIQSTESSNDAARNINQLLPVGKNVSATVVAVSRDQIQPEVFKLKLEINNRLIQLGVFQALPVGQKINVNRQSDGQIQVNIQPNNQTNTAKAPTNTPTQPTPSDSNRSQSPQQLQIPASNSNKLPAENRITAAVISSRPVYPQATQNQSSVSRPQIPQSHTQNAPASNAAIQSSPSQSQAPTPSAPAAVNTPTPPVAPKQA